MDSLPKPLLELLEYSLVPLRLLFSSCFKNKEDLLPCLDRSPGEQVQSAHGLNGLE